MLLGQWRSHFSIPHIQQRSGNYIPSKFARQFIRPIVRRRVLQRHSLNWFWQVRELQIGPDQVT